MTPEQEKKLVEAEKERASLRKNCKHEGWNFKEHGRCCFDCGAFIVDFGD